MEKEKVVAASAVGGGAVGGVGAIGAVAALGVPGLSAAGITSGLAAIGGSMLGGLVVCAVAPVALAAGAGYLAHKHYQKPSPDLGLMKHLLPK